MRSPCCAASISTKPPPMQKPIAPTFADVTESCESRKSTAPARSRAARSTGSSVSSFIASSASWATLPPNRSGASATKPSAASRSLTSAMWSVRPHHSWITMTPGPLPDGGVARYPWASLPLLGKVTFWRGLSVMAPAYHLDQRVRIPQGLEQRRGAAPDVPLQLVGLGELLLEGVGAD